MTSKGDAFSPLHTNFFGQMLEMRKTTCAEKLGRYIFTHKQTGTKLLASIRDVSMTRVSINKDGNFRMNILVFRSVSWWVSAFFNALSITHSTRTRTRTIPGQWLIFGSGSMYALGRLPSSAQWLTRSMFSMHMLFAAFCINVSDVRDCFRLQRTRFSAGCFRFRVSFGLGQKAFQRLANPMSTLLSQHWICSIADW